MMRSRIVAALIACGAVLTGAAAGHAQTVAARPPQWTQLREICWSISKTAGQCAVGLYGRFPTRDGCVSANGGQLEEQTRLQDGHLLASRCEMMIQ
jgi:hypothetical protein